MLKQLFLFVSLIFIISCASHPNITVISPLGEPIPRPSYILKTLDKNFQVTFFYSAIGGVKDLDNTIQPVPKFLDKNINHILSFKKINKLIVTIKVFNPKRISYTIYQGEAIKFKNGGDLRSLSVSGRSNLIFRTFEIELPFRKAITSAKVHFEIQKQDGSILIRTGTMEYHIY